MREQEQTHLWEAHPLPPDAPTLMPFQDQPFNGDHYVMAEVRRLKEKHGLTHAVETGTCLGSTTLFLAEVFDKVMSFEINEQLYNISKARCEGVRSIWLVHGDSEKMRPMEISHQLFFLDAHWEERCPLKGELRQIADARIRPVIVIHDFFVPGRPDLGYDLFPGGAAFSLEEIRPELENIYGGKYSVNYNTNAAGARRGVVYIEPAP